MANFRVGQKVVYIWSKIDGQARGQITPDPNAVYTVRATGLIGYQQGILLREIRNAPREWLNGYSELLMESWLFRPAVDKPTDISVFKEMLKPAKLAEFV